MLLGLGYGLDRWLFVLLLWTVLVFMPLRIAIESGESLGAGLRRAVAGRVAADPRRYEKSEYLSMLVHDLAARRVTLPRICRAEHRRVAAAAAAAVIQRANAAAHPEDACLTAIGTLLAVAEREASTLSAGATGAAADNIQTRWDAARALGALGALVTILAAAHEDRWGGLGLLPGLAGRTLEDYVAAAMDYCDEAALQVDAIPWTEPPLTADLPVARLEAVRTAWSAFVTAGLPAPRALEALVSAILPGARPGG